VRAKAAPTTAPGYLVLVGLAVVTVVVAAGLAVGTDARTRSRGDLTLAPPIALHGDRTVLPARAA